MGSQGLDVIVIGAGLSGLSSAKLLDESGLKVVVLEARDRVGGRTYTKRDPSSYKYVDLGGSYVGPSQNRILRLAKEYGIDTYRINAEGQYAFYFHKRCKKFIDSLPKYANPFIWLDMNNLLRTMDGLLEEIPQKAPWESKRASEWDHMTMQHFFDKTCWTTAAKDFGRVFVNANVASEPWEVSMLWFLWYVKNCRGVKMIWDVEGGAQDSKFIGGSMRISEAMAKQLGDKVVLSSPVREVTHTENGVTVTTLDGATYEGKHVVLAIAPTLYSKITFEPALPTLKSQLTQRVPMGCCIKSQTWYNTPFWRAKGYNGYSSSGDGVEPVGNTVDDCRPGDDYSSIVGFTLGEQARRLTNMSQEERKQTICEFYSRLFESGDAFHPVYYEDFDWLAEEYSGGCYTSTYPPGVLSEYGRELRTPFKHLYFAGTETAHEWSGYMDGAVQAGERAAREILHSVGRIAATQIWQDEPDNPDMPIPKCEYSFVEKYSPSVGNALLLLGTVGIASTVATTWLAWKHPEKLSTDFLTRFFKFN